MLKIYVCGPTVYDDVHIGNMRPILTFDFILKGFKALNKPFIFVHNLTDIDDKIIKKARFLNASEKEVSEKYAKNYLNLLKAFNINTITKIEKVTDNIDFLVGYIAKLLISNNAYVDKNHNIWFDVFKNKEQYGSVSMQNLEKMVFEEENEGKRNKPDFALWKNTFEGIKYKSHFGDGRPGWHTECCALIYKNFGSEGVDIHGGGIDLTFPHHENENIQHFALFNKPLSKEWLRTGQIMVEEVKMSKSIGNVILAKDFLKDYGPDMLKLIVLSSKISAPINITKELIENAKNIEIKYQKLVFKFFTKFSNFDSYKVKDDSLWVEIMETLSNRDFSEYNFKLNEAIKLFNKSKDIDIAKNIFNVLNVIHPDLTVKKRYEEAINDFNEWTYFIGKNDYKSADKIRAKLIKNNFY